MKFYSTLFVSDTKVTKSVVGETTPAVEQAGCAVTLPESVPGDGEAWSLQS
jgi:hypothetical protein